VTSVNRLTKGTRAAAAASGAAGAGAAGAAGTLGGLAADTTCPDRAVASQAPAGKETGALVKSVRPRLYAYGAANCGLRTLAANPAVERLDIPWITDDEIRRIRHQLGGT